MTTATAKRTEANAETVRLFKAIYVDANDDLRPITEDEVVRCVENGYFLDESVPATEKVLSAIEANVGISAEQLNKTFHKSWKTVSDTPIEALVAQQIFHYITTYGYESLGVYSEDTVYIPAENLDIPKVESSKGLSLVYIKGLTYDELYNKVVDLVSSGVALTEQSVEDLFTIIVNLGYSVDIVSNVKNRELKSKLYEYFDIAPSDPEEFVRYAVQKLTGETLVIKNDKLINLIKQSDAVAVNEVVKAAPADLASVFHRFKPIFLAMKAVAGPSDRNFFNRLRKQAITMHKPMKEDYLNTVTRRIKNGESLSSLDKALASANVFRKIRLLNALRMREEGTNKTVYSVRNGTGWVDDQPWPRGKKATLETTKKQVFNFIVADLAGLKGKTIYVPEGVSYAAPATEKQFTGNIPFGSSVSAKGDMIVGIYWTNNADRVDLDLSFTNMSGHKTGWDGSYRNSEMLFSGDITDAPKGATESFYCKGNYVNGIFMVNHYNRYHNDGIVEAKIFVGQDKKKNNHKNYTIDPNKVILSANVEIDNRQTAIAIMRENTVYFVGRNIGSGISARGDLVNATRDFYVKSLEKMLTLEEVLVAAGAKIVNEPEEVVDIDLSFGNIDKSTFIDILT